MRLLFVSHSFPPPNAPLSNVGGMQRVATELHSALAARDDVAMRTVALRSSWRSVHIKVVPFLASLAVRLVREAAAHRADTILFTSMTTAFPLLISGHLLKRKGIRLAAIAHGLDVTEPNPLYQMAVRRLCRMLDVAMPVSRATGEELVARGLPRERMHVVPNAVDLDRFEGVAALRGEPTRARIEGAQALSDDTFLLVAVGRLIRRKGFVWFIENVMPKLPDRVVFWLAGDGPERENIESAIGRAGLRRRVRCLGQISEEELVELYRAGTLFVMPNIVVPGDMEGFGIVMLEAGACGLPTLAADLEGIRDVIDEGVNGWFAPTGDANAFSARIESLLGDPDSLRAASERTAEYVTSKFRWDSTAERYLDAVRDR
ncbi:MAG: glycosyltransferase family 4 protein [Deltaproteobacteria bacterium]|nr:glycosyltransferase family 4 protein [Deltaproteobacteria bacterium]